MPAQPNLTRRIARKIVDFFWAEAPPARGESVPAIISATAGWNALAGQSTALAAVAASQRELAPGTNTTTADLARQKTVERILDGRTLDEALADNAKAIALQSTLPKPGVRRRNPPKAPI